jgi:hypothetical protein
VGEGEGVGGSQFGRRDRHSGTLGIVLSLYVYGNLRCTLYITVKMQEYMMYKAMKFIRYVFVRKALQIINCGPPECREQFRHMAKI